MIFHIEVSDTATYRLKVQADSPTSADAPSRGDGGQTVEYCLATGASAEDLKRGVAPLLAAGWRPHGGVALALGVEGRRAYAQAMIRGG